MRLDVAIFEQMMQLGYFRACFRSAERICPVHLTLNGLKPAVGEVRDVHFAIAFEVKRRVQAMVVRHGARFGQPARPLGVRQSRFDLIGERIFHRIEPTPHCMKDEWIGKRHLAGLLRRCRETIFP